jgi:hypothetical protein
MTATRRILMLPRTKSKPPEDETLEVCVQIDRDAPAAAVGNLDAALASILIERARANVEAQENA